MMAELKKSKIEVKVIADTDTFKEGENIVIGGQSAGKMEGFTPGPPSKGLWYDTEDVRG